MSGGAACVGSWMTIQISGFKGIRLGNLMVRFLYFDAKWDAQVELIERRGNCTQWNLITPSSLLS